ncbi:hypothetical protein [Haladaptatus cibarius]|uniref:hypothetical protein n=1 Tax=Haladaptatus cibarius TaxID=453847 RepID=UPI0011851B65|nr:hypothetical protein [Haladaptatus cibarius]
MTRDFGAPDEDIQSRGSLKYFLGVPLAVILYVGVVLAFVKGSEFVPNLPPLVDVLVLIVLIGVALYGVFRIGNLIK